MDDGPVTATASCSDKGYQQTRPVSNLTCGGQYEVLIADGSQTIPKLIQTHLENAGFNVIAVADGQHAWERVEERAAAEKRQFDLLVSDVEMPRMDGLFPTRKLRESRMASDLPIILFSSLITPDNLKKGQAVGPTRRSASPVCIKPRSTPARFCASAPAASNPRLHLRLQPHIKRASSPPRRGTPAACPSASYADRDPAIALGTLSPE